MFAVASLVWIGLLGAFSGKRPARPLPPSAPPGPPMIAPKSTGAAIPLRLSPDGHLLVPVFISGTAYPFMLDTAGGGLSITPATRDALGYTARDGITVRGYGASGMLPIKRMKFSSVFVLGKYPLGGLVTVIDLQGLTPEPHPPIAGIIGNGVLQNFDLELNLPAATLRLFPRGGKARPTGAIPMTSMPFKTRVGGKIFLPVQVNGQPITALLDTGALNSVLNRAALNLIGAKPGRDRGPVKLHTFSGFDRHVVPVTPYVFRQVQLGRLRPFSAVVYGADLPVFSDLGLRDRPAMLLGLDMLRDRILFISYSAGQIYLSEPRARKRG